jgi:hypothetical protein
MRQFMIPLSVRAKEYAAKTYMPPKKGNRIIKEDHYEFRARHAGVEYFPDFAPAVLDEEFREIQARS